eukprot:TRINITY_DN48574_c0_g1_i1.p1 TRINITY_DN48574_c0_g1~~TRINITY_DN48574_c0_g1_i1.p1  ORF type:complete len:578 (-),score=32.67 TRINITY_DN48574_c0_g1_i1:80-1813(-)
MPHPPVPQDDFVKSYLEMQLKTAEETSPFDFFHEDTDSNFWQSFDKVVMPLPVTASFARESERLRGQDAKFVPIKQTLECSEDAHCQARFDPRRIPPVSTQARARLGRDGAGIGTGCATTDAGGRPPHIFQDARIRPPPNPAVLGPLSPWSPSHPSTLATPTQGLASGGSVYRDSPRINGWVNHTPNAHQNISWRPPIAPRDATTTPQSAHFGYPEPNHAAHHVRHRPASPLSSSHQGWHSEPHLPPSPHPQNSPHMQVRSQTPLSRHGSVSQGQTQSRCVTPRPERPRLCAPEGPALPFQQPQAWLLHPPQVQTQARQQTQGPVQRQLPWSLPASCPLLPGPPSARGLHGLPPRPEARNVVGAAAPVSPPTQPQSRSPTTISTPRSLAISRQASKTSLRSPSVNSKPPMLPLHQPQPQSDLSPRARHPFLVAPTPSVPPKMPQACPMAASTPSTTQPRAVTPSPRAVPPSSRPAQPMPASTPSAPFPRAFAAPTPPVPMSTLPFAASAFPKSQPLGSSAAAPSAPLSTPRSPAAAVMRVTPPTWMPSSSENLTHPEQPVSLRSPSPCRCDANRVYH